MNNGNVRWEAAGFMVCGISPETGYESTFKDDGSPGRCYDFKSPKEKTHGVSVIHDWIHIQGQWMLHRNVRRRVSCGKNRTRRRRRRGGVETVSLCAIPCYYVLFDGVRPVWLH